MFEFFKKFNFGNNRNEDSKIIVSGNYNSVGYTGNKFVLREIDRWMREVGIYNISFGELLCKLGFVKYKNLRFEIIPSSDDKILLSFKSDGDLSKGDRLELSLKKTYSDVSYVYPDSYEIKISGDNYEIIYGVKRDMSLEDRLELVKKKDYIKENIDDKTYCRTIYENGFRNNEFVIVINNCYFSEIRLVCNKSDIKLNNEDELKEYLLNLDDSVSVNEVYRKICEISLGNENKYDKIELSLNKDDKIVNRILFQTKADYSLFAPMYKYEILENECVKSFNISSSIGEIFNGVRKRDMELVNKDYKISIKISPFNYETNIDMVGPLRDYLMSIEFPVKIDELCKNICDRCLMDINNLSYFKVECYYKNESIYMIYLKDGKLLGLELNREGKIIKIDENGMFSYRCDSEKGSFNVRISDDMVVGYETYMGSGIESDDMSNMICNHINQARDEKVKVRKLVDGVLKGEDSE